MDHDARLATEEGSDGGMGIAKGRGIEEIVLRGALISFGKQKLMPVLKN